MNTLLTKYGQRLAQGVHVEYPRSQLRRDSYLNLNGPWDFGISDDFNVEVLDSTIIVPFSPESVLSNISKTLGLNQTAFYKRQVTLPDGFNQGRLLLQFGAVDQLCWVYINQQLVCHHVGGFVPFSIDITPYVSSSNFEISLKVQDTTDTSYHLNGKQRLERGGIFYTPQSGIWQTVWMESVPNTYIEDLTITPNVSKQSVHIEVKSHESALLKVKLIDQGVCIKSEETPLNAIDLVIENPRLWSPEDPYLYDLVIEYGADVVHSYVGMRSFERKADPRGIQRFYLNGHPYFQSGVLDQGYYSDGLLTPPSDQAMIDDILAMKQLGFNMLRKHIKMEPMRWYYHCDRLGMLVWQDMMSGTEFKNVVFHHVLSIAHIHISDHFRRLFGRQNPVGCQLYEQDLTTLIQTLKNVTSICTWVPFNEAWGQFDTKRICKKVQTMDPTRLVDHVSGWSDQGVGDFHSRHIYFQKIRFYRLSAKKRILALTEFGGYSLPVEGHRFNQNDIFGYKTFETVDALESALKMLYLEKLKKEILRGLSVLIYTQLSDVEDEINGFLTYDRAIMKINPKIMLDIHEQLHEWFKKS